MKLSEMSNDRVFNVMTVLAAELEPILSDEKVMTLSIGLEPNKGEKQIDYGIRVAKKFLSVIAALGGEYRQRIFRVFAELSGCSVKEFGDKPFGETFKLFDEIMKDEVLISFFTSLKGSARAR